MKTHKILKIGISLALLLTINLVNAQKSKLAKANKEYDKYSFVDAQEIYLKVIEDGYESAEVYQRLGDTYYYNSNYTEASKWYGKLIEKYPESIEPIYFYRASQSLRSIGNNEEAIRLMDRYATLNDDAEFVNSFKERVANIDSIKKLYEIKKVGINTEMSDITPSFYQDNKIVFASASVSGEDAKIHSWSNQPFLDLFVANKDEDGSLSNAITLKGDVNTKYHESSAAFTKDGETMYFTRNNFYNGKKQKDKDKTIRLKIFKATKDESGNWTNIEELPFNGDDFSTAFPALNSAEDKLYFSSDREGTKGLSDLWYVTINTDGTYGDPVNLGDKVNTEARESFPFISKDNKLYFSSDGQAGFGGLDVYLVTLNNNGLPVNKPTNLGEPINSAKDDFGFIFNPKQQMGYMASNRGGNLGSASDDIYLVEKGTYTFDIEGEVTELATGKVIPDATVELFDDTNNLVASTLTDQNGMYSFKNLAPTPNGYVVRAKTETSDYVEKHIDSPEMPGVVIANLQLKTDPCAYNDLGCKLNLQPIYFDFDKYTIRKDSEVELAKILAAMRQYPNLNIHIESHTDSRGRDQYNMVLSENRAQATLQWLINHGIDKNRLTAKGYGESQLLNGCSNGVQCSKAEHQLNRRSEFIIIE